jgi:hypothetical protein
MVGASNPEKEIVFTSGGTEVTAGPGNTRGGVRIGSTFDLLIQVDCFVKIGKYFYV